MPAFHLCGFPLRVDPGKWQSCGFSPALFSTLFAELSGVGLGRSWFKSPCNRCRRLGFLKLVVLGFHFLVLRDGFSMGLFRICCKTSQKVSKRSVSLWTKCACLLWFEKIPAVAAFLFYWVLPGFTWFFLKTSSSIMINPSVVGFSPEEFKFNVSSDYIIHTHYISSTGLLGARVVWCGPKRSFTATAKNAWNETKSWSSQVKNQVKTRVD